MDDTVIVDTCDYTFVKLIKCITQAVNCRLCMHAKSLQSCPTPCDPMDRSPSGSSVHRILQAGILKWAAISFSKCRL